MTLSDTLNITEAIAIVVWGLDGHAIIYDRFTPQGAKTLREDCEYIRTDADGTIHLKEKQNAGFN